MVGGEDNAATERVDSQRTTGLGTPSQFSADALDSTQIRSVLRYWLASLRHEEALSQQIRAARGGIPVRPWSWTELPETPPYFKLTPAGRVLPSPDEISETAALDNEGNPIVAFLLQQSPAMPVFFGPEHHGFLAAWVRRAYWRERSLGDDDDGACVVGFPVVHFGRRGLLDTLLRFNTAAPQWKTPTGSGWAVPSASDRRAHRYPVLPSSFDLSTHDSDKVLPYALNLDFASRVLGVPWEDAQALLDHLLEKESVAPEQMIRAVIGLISETECAAELKGEALWKSLCEATASRVALPDTKVWPIALVHPADTVSASFHVQRDLGSLLDTPPHHQTTPSLWHYLSAHRAPPSSKPLFALLASEPLAPGQREAGELAQGSVLSAAQGPPGTGKTHLVRHLIAGAVVERLAILARFDRDLERTRPKDAQSKALFGGPAVLVTSTNNRAVDNALDPFIAELPRERLLLALRLGNREVTSEVSAAALERTAGWLEVNKHDPAEFQRARKEFLSEYKAVQAAYRPLTELAQQMAKRAEAERELQVTTAEIAAIDQQTALSTATGEAVLISSSSARALKAQILSVVEMANALADRLEPHDDSPNLWPRKTQQKWNRIATNLLPALQDALSDAAPGRWKAPTLPMAQNLADSPHDLTRCDWLDSTNEDLYDIIDDMEKLAKFNEQRQSLKRKRETLRVRAARLQQVLADPAPDDAALGTLSADIDAQTVAQRHRLWTLATAFREAWALAHAAGLVPLCRQLAHDAKQRKSLRARLERDPEIRDQLWALFPAAGCTLLSLGNAFPPEPSSAGLAIVDEGGQCHPAYAVSALVRSSRTLVIGDTNQLEPVVQLDAAEERRILSRLGWENPPPWLTPYRVTDRAPSSAQAIADHAVQKRPVLADHFRSQPDIIAISDALCGYGLRVHTPPNSLAAHCDWLDRAVRFVSVRGQQQRMGGSWANEAEVQVILRALHSLREGGVPLDDIAVLTPYRGQLDALRYALRRAGLPVDWGAEPMDESTDLFRGPAGRGIAVGTVHRFQGGEKAVVLLSTVVTEPRSLAFLNERVNLVNVAVSRARLHFVGIGHADVLAQGHATCHLVAPRGSNPAAVVQRD